MGECLVVSLEDSWEVIGAARTARCKGSGQLGERMPSFFFAITRVLKEASPQALVPRVTGAEVSPSSEYDETMTMAAEGFVEGSAEQMSRVSILTAVAVSAGSNDTVSISANEKGRDLSLDRAYGARRVAQAYRQACVSTVGDDTSYLGIPAGAEQGCGSSGRVAKEDDPGRINTAH